MTKLILKSLIVLLLGFSAVAPVAAGGLGQPWDKIGQEGQ